MVFTPDQGSGVEEYYGFHQEIQATAASELDGFVVRQDYNLRIRDYIRKNVVFWNLITQKEPAEADLVQDIQEAQEPTTGFFDKNNMGGLVETPTNFQNYDFSDPGQRVKSGGGLIKLSYYSQSLWEQQGKPYGTQVAKKTAKLIRSTVKTIERTLFKGNALTNPLEFNGIEAQMFPGHAYEITKLGSTPDSIVKKLGAIVRLAINHEDILRTVTHIFTSGLGCELIEDEVDGKLEYRNLDVITPGLSVPQINTQAGQIPIVISPYLLDVPDTGVGYDLVEYFLIDMNQVRWKGVYPKGGAKTLEPQIFEVSKYTNDTMQYMIEKRMCIFFGTLKLDNLGQGVWKLSVRVPSGTIGSI